jgi:hypothetical protein
VAANDAPQPQARRHRHGHRHPHPAAHQLHPQLVGLDVLQVDSPLLDQVLMHPLAVLIRAGQPRGHGALIGPEGRNDGLDRTAVAQQSQDERHHVCARPQPVEGRVGGGRDGLTTGGTPIALLPLAMHTHVPLPTLSSSGAL